MKIYYDTDRNLIVVEGTRAVWPPLSLVTVQGPGTVTIAMATSLIGVAGPLPWSQVQDKDGGTFQDLPSATAYLDGEFTKERVGEVGPRGPQGPPGPQGPYRQTTTIVQATASTVWSVIHNLGFYPAVTTADSTGEIIFGTIHYVDINTVSVTFGYPISGTSYLN